MKVLSLFDGISCGMLALQKAGFHIDTYVSYEIEKKAIEISKRNFPNIQQMGSVIEADFTKYKGFDFVIGGFPCQDLSIGKAGREGLKGARSGLFWELERAIREVRPKYFLVENNYGMPKEAEKLITEILGVTPIMIDSGDITAQRRKRLYWTNIPNIQQPEKKNIELQSILESGLAYTKKAYCLTANYTGAYPADLFKSVRSQVLETSTEGIGFKVENETITIRGYKRAKGRETVKVPGVPDGWYTLRPLTIKECCKLQTVPESYFEGFNRNDIIKALGNGWTVDIIAHIFSFATKDLFQNAFTVTSAWLNEQSKAIKSICTYQNNRIYKHTSGHLVESQHGQAIEL